MAGDAILADHAAIIAGSLAVAAMLGYLASVGRTGKRHCPRRRRSTDRPCSMSGPMSSSAMSRSDVDRWLAEQARIVSTRTLRLLHSIRNRSVNRTMARDLVMRNVVALCTVPRGKAGRPSKSLTFDQAMAVLIAAVSSSLHAYVVLSLLTGARTEEPRALAWEHVDLTGRPEDNPPVPPSMNVWRSVRDGGDTKTRRSRRTLALPQRCVQALADQRYRQGGAHLLVFPAPPERNWIDTTSCVLSDRSSRTPGSTPPHGLLASCGTASSRSCRATG